MSCPEMRKIKNTLEKKINERKLIECVCTHETRLVRIWKTICSPRPLALSGIHLQPYHVVH